MSATLKGRTQNGRKNNIATKIADFKAWPGHMKLDVMPLLQREFMVILHKTRWIWENPRWIK
jgi:hypothetical protein